MRALDPNTTALLSARSGLISRRLVWIEARRRDTGAVEALGLWNGDYELSIALDGEARTYRDVGALLDADPITAGSGLEVRVLRLSLSGIPSEIEDLVKAYDTRFAPVTIHRAVIDPASQALAGNPHRAFRGMINSLEFTTPEPGGAQTCTLELVSETRALTRKLALKKSDESQTLRGGDRLRRYGNISGAVPVYWGELYAAAANDPAPTKPRPSREDRYESERG